MRTTSLPLPLLLLALLASAPAVAASESSAEAVRPQRLERPAQPELTRSLVASALHTGTPDPAELALELGAAGGHAAAEGLTELLTRGGRQVLVPAFEAAGRVGLRYAPLAQILRRVASEQEAEVLVAAIDALGRVGDGSDAPRLLRLASAESPHVRAAAFRALRALAGTPVPPVASRWRWHWQTIDRRAKTDLMTAIHAVEANPRSDDMSRHLQTIRAYGWANLPVIHETAYAWLVGADRELRRLGCWIVGELRLADHVQLIENTYRLAQRGALREEAARALQALGARPPAAGRSLATK